MNLASLPWLELGILVPLLGSVLVGLCRDSRAAFRWTLGVTSATLVCSLLALWAFETQGQSHSAQLADWVGWPIFQIDELSAPLIPLVALLHLLTTLATARTKMNRVMFGGLLLGEAIRLGIFATLQPWLLVSLAIVGVIPPWPELIARGKPTRVYLIHMGLFALLLVTGQILVSVDDPAVRPLATLILMLAVLVRSGTIPTHCWIVDLFEHASFATALLQVTPIAGVYVAMRLVLPIAPDSVLQWIGFISLLTALYAAGMALIQREARRFFAYLFLSHASLVLVGLELHTPISLTGGLCLWVSVALSLGGLGLTLRALEARFGRLSLADYHGLYEHTPTLAVAFLLTGLASVGFPGTLGFIAAELLVDGAIVANPFLGVTLILTCALNSIAIVRVYLILFTGRRIHLGVSVRITLRERIAVLTLACLILGGGAYPQPGVRSRNQAAVTLLEQRPGQEVVPTRHE